MKSNLTLVYGAKNINSKKTDYINYNALSEPKTGVLFVDFINSTIIRKSKRMGDSYLSSYKTLISHIKNFSGKHEADIFTNSVNEFFLDDFISYLEDLGLKKNYIASLISLSKTMVKKAGMYGYAVDASYDDVSIKEEETFSIFLSMNEITRIYYYKGLSHKKERIRDLFVIGCLTALRYSDYSDISKENIQGNFIVKISKKTKTKVVVPIHQYVHEIIKKYDGDINFGISIQHFNRYIKLICKEVGIDSEIVFNYTRGGNLITEKKNKWELVSSHTARRSAATNAYLTGRMRTYDIMSLTGHTTEKSFFRYIKTTTEDKANQISSDIFFKI